MSAPAASRARRAFSVVARSGSPATTKGIRAVLQRGEWGGGQGAERRWDEGGRKGGGAGRRGVAEEE